MVTTSRYVPAIVVFITLLIPVQSVGEDVSVAQFTYNIEESTRDAPIELQVQLSNQGLRYDFQQETDRYTLIHRSGSDPVMFVVNHEDAEAVRVSPDDLDQFVEIMKKQRKRILQQLESLPESQRKMVREKMDIPEIDPESTAEVPEFTEVGSTTWKDLEAIKGTFRTSGETVGEAVISREPVLELSREESAVLDEFVGTLRRWVHLSSQLSETRMNDPRNLIAERYPSLLEYRSESGTMTLVDWNRVQQSTDRFEAPSGYQVRSLGDLVSKAGNAMQRGR